MKSSLKKAKRMSEHLLLPPKTLCPLLSGHPLVWTVAQGQVEDGSSLICSQRDVRVDSLVFFLNFVFYA